MATNKKAGSTSTEDASASGNPSLMNLLRSQGDPDSVQILGRGDLYDPEKVVGTGSVTLDYALGRGGVVRGKVMQVYGPPASGKSTVVLNMIANLHKWLTGPESYVVFFDAEFALDPELLGVLGVDPDRLPHIEPESLEDFINRATGLLVNIKEGKVPPVPMIVLDSVASIRSKEYDEKDADKRATMAPEARLWAERLPRLVKLADQVGCMIVLINQSREKKKSMPGGGEYIEYHTPGGDQIKFANSINIFCKQYKGESEIDRQTGEKLLHGMQVKIEKNKTSGRLGKALVRWRVDEPISAGWGLVDVLELLDRRDNQQKRKLDYDPDTFLSALDDVPYARDYNWDKKTDGPKSSANRWMIQFSGDWDDIKDAILTDDPDFDDDGLGGIGFAKKADFVEFVDRHPTMAELINEYVRETLNLKAEEIDEQDGETDFVDPDAEEYDSAEDDEDAVEEEPVEDGDGDDEGGLDNEGETED